MQQVLDAEVRKAQLACCQHFTWTNLFLVILLLTMVQEGPCSFFDGPLLLGLEENHFTPTAYTPRVANATTSTRTIQFCKRLSSNLQIFTYIDLIFRICVHNNIL